MENGKEKKVKVKPASDPVLSLDANEFFNNTLSLSDTLKSHMSENNLDWRFINITQFRAASNTHRSRWQPFTVPDAMRASCGATAEGLIQRGDVLLAVRDKAITAAHKKILADKTRRQSGYNKQAANELRQLARENKVQDQSKVYEGYEDND